MAIRYDVDGCDDDQGALRDVLSRIAEKTVVLLVLRGSPTEAIRCQDTR